MKTRSVNQLYFMQFYIFVLNLWYVYENNRYSEHTHASYVIASESIASRVEGFGIHTVKANGFDCFEVHEVMKELITKEREGIGPCAVEFETTRFYGHFEGDPQTIAGG